MRKVWHLSKNLKKQLTPHELQVRKDAFEALEKFVEQHEEIYAQYIRSFEVKNSPDERVDLEVRKGIAFFKNKNHKK